MTSDFDKDEIKDASFPVDFNDDSVSLDMFGVWVKSGPRDARVDENASLTDFHEISDPSEKTDPVPRADSFIDISDLPDLPDFDQNSGQNAVNIESEDSVSVETGSFPEITFEEIVTETSDTEQNSVDETGESSPARVISVSNDTSDIDLDSFLDESIASVKASKEIELESAEESEATIIQSQPDEATITGFDEIDAVPFGETVSTLSGNEPISFVSGTETDFAGISAPGEPESFAAFDASLSSGSEYTLSEEPLVTSLSGLREAIEQEQSNEVSDELVAQTLSRESDDDFSGFLDDLNSGNIPDMRDEPLSVGFDSGTAEKESAPPSDDDFSSFLDDLNSGSPQSAQKQASSGDDLDLDDFINSVNESGTSSKEDAEKVFSDTAPVDIDLEFDESFIEDVQKIRATGAAVSESEFFNSEFGVELIDETSAGAASSSFDEMFSGISDLENAGKAETAVPSLVSAIESTDEFDDLLTSLDLAPAPAPVAAKSGQKSVPAPKKQGYDLVVSDEGNDTISATVSETSVDDDIIVSLSGDAATSSPVKLAVPEPQVPDRRMEETSDLSLDEELIDFFVKDEPLTEKSDSTPLEQEKLDLPDIRDYNESNSDTGTDDSACVSMEDAVTLEFDDISAVEKELNDFVPDAGEAQVVTNDKSTELLMIIADELSSIKKEISTLKSEIAGFKTTAGEPLVDGAPVPEHENSGFFTDDDTDETIALTGDELNNILITADFTEEKSSEDEEVRKEDYPLEVAQESVSEIEMTDTVAPAFGEIDIGSMSEPFAAPEIGPDSFTVTDTEVSTENDDFSLGEIPVGTITEPVEPEIPDILPDSILDTPEMDIPLTVDVSHVTTIDDDTSYLEGSDVSDPDLDNVAIEEPELEIIDFEDEKLEEPELTEFNIDLTDISSELPAEQEVAVPSDEPDTIAVSASVEDSIPVIDEGFEEPSVEPAVPESTGVASLPVDLKDEIKSVLSYMDQLLESLPEEKIEEFARSEHFEVYKKLFEELGIS